MKILMFGRGAIATLYGWAFSKAGHKVEYFVRPSRMQEYGDSLPIRVLDARATLQGTMVSETMPTRLRDSIPENHDFDLIIVSVQHYSFEGVAAFLAPRVGNATVLVFNNFWKDPEAAASALPADQLAWGFPAAGGGFPKGVLTGSLFKTTQFGTFGTPPTARELAVREMFRQAGFGVAEHLDFRSWLLSHFALAGGLLAESLLLGSSVQLMESGAHRRSVIRNVRELVPLLKSRGVNVGWRNREVAIAKLPVWIGGLALGLAWKLIKPMRLAFESHTTPDELLFTCRDLLLDAQERDIPTPRLAAALAHARKTGLLV